MFDILQNFEDTEILQFRYIPFEITIKKTRTLHGDIIKSLTVFFDRSNDETKIYTTQYYDQPFPLSGTVPQVLVGSWFEKYFD